MKAWYFSNTERKLRYNDGRYIKEGETHVIEGTLKLCSHGLHASRYILDALSYAPSCILWSVELSGTIIEGTDKLVASERTYLKCIDATEILREFARKQASVNISKIKPYCKKDDYKLIKEWLLTGDSKLRYAAESAAWSAAWSASRSTAEPAAMSAARSAAMSAWSASRSARFARSAAMSAAESTTWSAWSASRSAAWSAAESMLADMINKALKSSY